MADLGQAWQAYHGGNYERAARLFEDRSGPDALAGKALTLLAAGRGGEAAAMVEHRLQRAPSPQLEALLADVRGRQGKRSEAERILTNTISRRGEGGFYSSLRGEQRIRLGKWEEGTNDFIAAVNQRDERTIPHLQQVVADMVDAVSARRIPREDAARFINRIDYSASEKTQAINSFLAAARRALNANRRLDRSDIKEPWSVVDGSESTPAGPPGRANRRRNRPSQRPSSAPPSAPPPEVERTGSDRANSDHPSPAQSTPKRSDELQQRLAERPEQPPREDEPTVDAKQKNMSAVMQQERRENESLQDLVADVQPPIWPSDTEEPIDVIEPIGFSDHSILRGSSSIETANFRITGGEISVEITLERCMHNLVAAAQAKKPTTLALVPESIPRVELNLLDGFLEDMPELDKLYRDESEVDDARPLGLGKFIGECIVQSYGGIWHHAVPAEESVIHLGDHILDPIGLAREFFDADDFDAVSLRRIINEAEDAIDTSTSFPTFTDYLDATSGLEREALSMRLAELWVGYRFSLPDTAVQEIAAGLEITEVTPNVIAFAIDADHVPGVIVDHLPGGLDARGRAPMAYLRNTGEFLLPAIRKHFCRLVETTEGKQGLRRDVAPTIAGWIRDLFRPGWNVAADKKSAVSLRKKHSLSDLKAPKLRQKGDAAVLRLHAVDESGERRSIKLLYDDSRKLPWELSVQ